MATPSEVNATISRLWSCGALIVAIAFGLTHYLLGYQMSLVATLWIAAISMLIFGIAHGGLDHLVAAKLWREKCRNPNIDRAFQLVVDFKFYAVFLFGYAALALLIVFIWQQWPTMSLSFFLLISAFHFGEDLRLNARLTSTPKKISIIQRIVASLTLGGAIIITPWTFHTEEVATIFAWLSRADAADWQGLRLHLVQAVYLLMLFILILKYCPRLANMREWLAIVLLFIFAPPLVAFALYFSFLHALQHMVSLADYLYRELPAHSLQTAFWRANLNAAPLSLITISIGLATWIYWPTVSGIHQHLADILFIGLAALTVPHMLLVAVWEKGRG